MEGCRLYVVLQGVSGVLLSGSSREPTQLELGSYKVQSTQANMNLSTLPQQPLASIPHHLLAFQDLKVRRFSHWSFRSLLIC